MSSYYEDIEIRRREDGQLVSLVQITDLGYGEITSRARDALEEHLGDDFEVVDR